MSGNKEEGERKGGGRNLTVKILVGAIVLILGG